MKKIASHSLLFILQSIFADLAVERFQGDLQHGGGFVLTAGMLRARVSSRILLPRPREENPIGEERADSAPEALDGASRRRHAVDAVRRILLLLLGALAVVALLAFLFRTPLATRVMRAGLERNLGADVVTELPDGLHVMLCGAGGPLPDPKRSGPCVAVIAGRGPSECHGRGGDVGHDQIIHGPRRDRLECCDACDPRDVGPVSLVIGGLQGEGVVCILFQARHCEDLRLPRGLRIRFALDLLGVLPLLLTEVGSGDISEVVERRHTRIPIVVYNVPSRTSVNLLPETVARLGEFPNIVAIKEATGDLKQCAKVAELCGDNITLLSGDDFTVLPLLAIGGQGVISVVSNVTPQDMAGMCDAFVKGDLDTARKLHYKMWPLMEAMFFETNPAPAKTALKMMGKITGEVRQPLCPMSSATADKLRQVLQKYGLI